MGRLFRWIDLPKALLPLWLLALIILGATALGFVVADAGAPGFVAVLVAAVASWGPAVAVRIALVRRGRTGYEDLPSADWDYNDSPSVQGIAELLNGVAWFGAGVGAAALVRATGLEADGDIWLFPLWMVIGVVAAAPALTEADARYGLWVRRRRLREEAAIRGEDEAGGPSEAPVAGITVVPLHRGKVWAYLVLAILFAAGGGALAILAEDMSVVERVIVGLAAPVFLVAGAYFARMTRAPHFLRLTPTGADLLGTGEIPWEAIATADVSAHSRNRWLTFGLENRLGAEPWATPGVRRLAKRSKGDAVETMIRFSAWPAERVAAAIRQAGRVDVEAYLA